MKTKKMLKKIRGNQQFIVVLLILVALLVVVQPVQAMNITMANPSGISQRDILVYDSAGQLYGLYNSTSTISINGSEDYVFAIKPVSVNPLEDPTDWLTNDAFPFVQTYAIGITLIVVLAAFWKAK